MMFDPEKVERFNVLWNGDVIPDDVPHLEVVYAKDFDELVKEYGLVCELLRITQSYVDNNPPKP